MFESSIGTHLTNHSVSGRYNFFYWREVNEEVDFVMEKDGKVIAIEVKSGKRGENKGMNTFADKFHPEKVLLVGNGGIPHEEFLKIKLIELF